MEHERISEPADAVIASESDQPENGQDAAPAVEVATPQPKQPKQFSSELSAILTTLGAAVGTGNIWRFPRILARNTTEGGGLLFIISWMISLFCWSIPLIIAEYAVGRKGKMMHANAFRRFLGPKHTWKGMFIIFVQLAVSCYYIVINSWCIYYLFYTISHPLPTNAEESGEIFRHLTEETGWPALLTFLIALFVYGCLSKGITTIEKINLCCVPILFFLILVGFYYSLFLPKAAMGVALIFRMDWATLKKGQFLIDGLAQNAWDTGAGTGVFLTYSTIMPKSHKVVFYSLLTPIINNMISLMMGITTFAAAFDYLSRHHPEMTPVGILEIMKENGPANTGMTLVWMPVFFENFPNGRAICTIFYLCLTIAGLTSLISMTEMVVRQVTHLKIRRKIAAPAVCAAVCIGGFCNTNLNFLANQDYTWGYGSILCGAFLCYLISRIGVEEVRVEFINKISEEIKDFKVPRAWGILIALLVPFQIFLIFMWWIEENARKSHLARKEFILDHIRNGTWDPHDRRINKPPELHDDFIWCITQWTLVMVALSMLNRAYDFKWKHKFNLFDDPEPEPEPAPQPAQPKYEVSDLPSYEEVTRSPVSLNPANLSASFTNPAFTPR